MRKSGGFTESLRFTKNQADLQNPCVLQIIRRIYRILALYKKSGRVIKSLRLQKNRRTKESLQAVKFPRLVKKPVGLEKLAALLLFRLGGISSCDLFLVWLKSSRSDPHRCDVPLMQSPSEETAQAALLL
jgi:hypothetical protein